MAEARKSIGLSKKLLAAALPALPSVLSAAGLYQLQTSAGVDWAYSLFDTNHWLNFGGNPAEVYSHLLNWLVMTGSMGCLCAMWISILLARTDRLVSCISPVIFILSVLMLSWWATVLDGKNGEGAVFFTFLFFFGPCIALHAIGVCCYLWLKMETWLQAIACIGLFLMTVQFEWIYQRSGSGGPNWLVIPLLAIQVTGHWMPAIWLLRRKKLGSNHPG